MSPVLLLSLSFFAAVVHFGRIAGCQQIPVLPIPQRAQIATGSGCALHVDFTAAVHSAAHVAAAPKAASSDAAGRSRLERAVRRFGLLVAPAETAAARRKAMAAGAHLQVLRKLDLNVENFSDELSIATDVAYTLSVSGTEAVGHAKSIYGAMYAMTTFAQLVNVESGLFIAANLTVSDAPEFVWRGLMVDTGRRFAPLSLLHNIIDTMSAVKLNVLHLHLSDFCRFAVESKLYPNLTASLVGANAGHYTQDEIRALLIYAKDRGVRIVPEFEMPGHALGFKPIATPGGLEFCATCAYPDGCMPSQLKATPGTFRVLHEVLGEMATLFEDQVFHIGADETFVNAGDDCDENATAVLERRVVEAVADDFNKTPAGWEQVLFKTAAATQDTIVYSYMQPVAAVTATGHRAVECNASMYFTVPMAGSPTNWADIWYVAQTRQYHI
jgi:hexosaminidase